MTKLNTLTLKEQLIAARDALTTGFCCFVIGFFMAGFYDYQGAIYFSVPHAVNFGALLACCGALAIIWDRLTRRNDDPFIE